MIDLESDTTQDGSEFPPLQFPCPRCHGEGRRLDARVICSGCEGARYFPTDFGHAVLDLVRRNLSVKESHLS